MVGFQDSINLVQESLRDSNHTGSTTRQHTEVDHDQILRDYDTLMREHERRMNGHRRHVKRHRETRSRHGDDNEGSARSRSRSQSPRPPVRLRFKSDKDKTRSHRSSGRSKRQRRNYHDDDMERDGRKEREREPRSAERGSDEEDESRLPTADLDNYAAHPFARPRLTSTYLDPTLSASASASASPQPSDHSSTFAPPRPATPPPVENETFEGPDEAFRASLFDAMADDEGAAYWEGVYGEPIHVYTRPTVRTASGGLEQMSDQEYVEYVKRKMWEKKNPELVQEREDRARRDLEEEQKRAARSRRGNDEAESGESDYEWIGNEEKGYQRRRVRGKPHRPDTKSSSRRSNTFMSDVDAALARGARRKEAKKWQQAWTDYTRKWADALNTKSPKDNNNNNNNSSSSSTKPEQKPDIAQAIPWPVLDGKPKTARIRDNVEDFFRNHHHYAAALASSSQEKPNEDKNASWTALLKAERFRWHPDKIQHRFGGGENVDADTLALVTSVFQIIDGLMAKARNEG